MSSKRFGLSAMLFAAAVMCVAPSASAAKPVQLLKAQTALRQVTTGLGKAVQSTVDTTVAKTDAALRKARDKARAAAARKNAAADRATATDPQTQPPLHGSDPHAQGGVAVVDVNPSSQRPLDPDPSGKASGEDVIVGRARGEQVNGAYHGHITIASVFGSEIAGVDTAPGETKNGPLQPIQTGVLDPLCTNTNQQVCLSVLTANSTTTDKGSTNDFAVARASLLGLGVGAAESHGDISQDATCQTAAGSSKTANVSSPGGAAVAQVANSTSTSKSCRGAAAQVTNTSQVIGLGGIQVPIPAAGCANGTPDTLSGIPAVLPIVCNADDIAGSAAVREALDVYVLQVGGTSLAKETTAASESVSVAPAAATETTPKQCSDGIDNDGDGKIDAKDPGCHSDNNANNPASYNPNHDNEADRTGGTGGSGHASRAQCADKKDNDGDGLIDAKDPGCHTDANANNPSSYDPTDNSEAGGGNGGGGNGNGAGTGGQTANASTLPFTGTDVVGLSLAGLLMLGGGLLLRRREDSHAGL